MKDSNRFGLRLAVTATAATFLLAGCGLAETTAVAATEAELAAEQIKEGKKLEEKVQRDVEAAQQAAADARAKAETDSQ
jgi:outer membrane murein-binding lipoprotein Lpp